MRGERESHRVLEFEAPPEMSRVRIVLVEPRHPGNIGSTARAMKTVGLTDLVLVRPVPFRDTDEAISLASGARDVLETARVVATLEEALEGLHWVVGTTNRRRGGILDQPVPVREAAARIAALARAHRVGILFGREDFGLSSEDLARCNQAAAIPTAAGMPPLNLSHAVQVVAHEVFSAVLGEPAPAPPRLAAVSEVEALLRRFAEMVELVGPRRIPSPPDRVAHSLRRAFSRLALEPRDVRTLHMVIRGANWRLKECRDLERAGDAPGEARAPEAPSAPQS